ncbi:hypothetical protein MSAN_01424300 [Mycena sanguinolenta]|uniref:Uncharacterized protein n=1 Tax=Mycena sanguinolenta TaxID=230812 RepID=A0A8H6Y8B6_9AGAR|nr:hypothetical protein MSAN_01424300 [Mycena sanguinolenta]
MYRAPSPFGANYVQQAQIAPGQVTYTTCASRRAAYSPHLDFLDPQTPMAESCITHSGLSRLGIVSGIQWVPAEATRVLPQGAQPANAEFAASWSRTPISKDEQKALKDWQRDEEKRRKKEEKEAKRQREKEQKGYADAEELRKARERDAHTLGRRKSFNQGVAFPGSAGSSGGYSAAAGYTANNAGYPSTPYTAGYNGVPPAGYDQRERKYSTGVSDLDRQFGEMGLDRSGEYPGERERKISGLSRPKTYQTEAERTRKISNNYGSSYPPVVYPNTAAYPAQTGAPYPSAYPNASPNMRPGESPQVPYGTSAYASAGPMPRPTTPYAGPPGASPYGGGQSAAYPPGHVMEGRPIPGTTPTIPSAVPTGYAPFPQQVPMAESMTNDQGQLAAPEGFSRPINAAQAFTPFEKMKVQDMDSIVDNPPRMPAVLQPHDVYPADWNRMMQDLCLAWTGRLPAPGRPQKKAHLAAELIDMWNISFFFPRGVEVVLYKGRERRTGPSAGVVDIQHYDEDEESTSSSSSSEDSDSDGGKYPPAAYMYGQQQAFIPGQGSMAQVIEQRNRRREVRAEKKRRRKEKKARRKEKARAKRFALYLTCVPPGGGPAAAGYGGAPAAGYGGQPAAGYGGQPAAGYGGQPAAGYGGQLAAGYGGQPAAGYGGQPAAGYGVPAAPGSVSGGMPTMGAMGMGAAGMHGANPMGYPAMGTMGAPGYGAVAGGVPMSNQSGGY